MTNDNYLEFTAAEINSDVIPDPPTEWIQNFLGGNGGTIEIKPGCNVERIGMFLTALGKMIMVQQMSRQQMEEFVCDEVGGPEMLNHLLGAIQGKLQSDSPEITHDDIQTILGKGRGSN